MKAAERKRKKKALERLEAAWNDLEASDLSETRWSELQRVILSLRASLERAKRS